MIGTSYNQRPLHGRILRSYGTVHANLVASRLGMRTQVRAGVLEQNTVELMRHLGISERVAREGLVHRGTHLAIDGKLFRIDFAALTGGKTVTVYGQQEVMRDLYDAAALRDIAIVWNAEGVTLSGLEGDLPAVDFRHGDAGHHIDCDYVVGCDAFRGVIYAGVPAVQHGLRACRQIIDELRGDNSDP